MVERASQWWDKHIVQRRMGQRCHCLGGQVPGVAQKTGPLSTVLGVTVVNAIPCQTIANLVARGSSRRSTSALPCPAARSTAPACWPKTPSGYTICRRRRVRPRYGDILILKEIIDDTVG